MALIHAEHEAVDDLHHDRHVRLKFGVISVDRLRKLYLYKLVELLSALSSVRAAVKQAHEHKPRDVDSTLSEALTEFAWFLFIKKSLVKHELPRETALLADI